MNNDNEDDDGDEDNYDNDDDETQVPAGDSATLTFLLIMITRQSKLCKTMRGPLDTGQWTLHVT